VAFIKATKRRHWASTRSDSINRSSQCRELAIFKEFQVPEMARSSWMAKKFTRGMTYQSDGKDLANGVENLYWGAKVVS
jgi:hypothetical protein